MGLLGGNAAQWNALLEEVRMAGIIIFIVIIVTYIIQAILTAALARQKGYSGMAGLLLGLIVPGIGLIYEAGRPLSAEKEEERQRFHAREIARVLRRDVMGEEQPIIKRKVS